MVCTYPRSRGIRILCCSTHVIAVATTITKATAIVMPYAAPRFLETPTKGHMPRNWENTILFTSMAVRTIDRYSSMFSGSEVIEQSDHESQGNEGAGSEHHQQGSVVGAV